MFFARFDNIAIQINMIHMLHTLVLQYFTQNIAVKALNAKLKLEKENIDYASSEYLAFGIGLPISTTKNQDSFGVGMLKERNVWHHLIVSIGITFCEL